MAKRRKFHFRGAYCLSSDIAPLLGMSNAKFLHRINHGWQLKHDILIPPQFIRKEHYMSKIPISRHDHIQLQKSFIGDPEISDNLYV